MFNKGLEVIEAHWLFGMDFDRIEVVIQPQSIVHSMIQFIDGSVLAQLGMPDMRLPIQYAFTYPDRLSVRGAKAIDWKTLGSLEFFPPDDEKFPSIGLAYEAGRIGGTMPCVLNGANEVAVYAFLRKEISFTRIFEIVHTVMERHDVKGEVSSKRSARQIPGLAAVLLLYYRKVNSVGITILATIFVFSIIVFIHELGHLPRQNGPACKSMNSLSASDPKYTVHAAAIRNTLCGPFLSAGLTALPACLKKSRSMKNPS